MAGQKGSLFSIVKKIISKKQKILALTKKHATPFYALDQAALETSINKFLVAFKTIPNLTPFYPIKANPHPQILKTVLKFGFGLDASSGRELIIALKTGAKQIIFSGPGKTISELNLAVKNHKQVILNIDSFSELKKIGALLKNKKIILKAGVRVTTHFHSDWQKFGIPLTELKLFWQAAKKTPQLSLQGLQSHSSFNETADNYQNIIKEISRYLKTNFSSEELREVKFFDFGGGFLPFQAQGYYPFTTPQGQIIKIAREFFGSKTKFLDKYYISPSVTLPVYAQGIAAAINKYLKPLLNCQYYTEPGRIISHNALHIVLSVVDEKKRGVVIMDGGINITGWERFEEEYFPIINLTHFSRQEIPCTLYGNLCTPADIWGYYCYASQLKEGDILVVPDQGAYTYTWAQNFIKPIPPVYLLK